MSNGESKKNLKFLCVSRLGCVGDLCIRLQEEGHKARYYIDDKEEKDISDGFVEKAERWEDFKDWADVIVFDDADFGGTAEALRQEGKGGIGGSTHTDRPGTDPGVGQQGE